MHGATQSPAVTGSAAQQLGHHRVEVAALGDDVPVAPMVAHDVVARLEDAPDSHRHGLLPDTAVCRAEDDAVLKQIVRPVLKPPDAQHLAVEVQPRLW